MKTTRLTVSVLIVCLLMGLLTALSGCRGSASLDHRDSNLQGADRYRFSILAAETDFPTSIPVAFYDFTDPAVKNTFSTISFHVRTVEGEYTSLEAAWNDPQCTLNLPEGVKPVDLGYALFVYRTTAQRKGEFFAARSDNPTMGTPGTHVQWDWKPSGNWETLLIENKAWMGASEEVTFQGFRFDPLESNVQNGETIDFQFMAFFTTKEEAEAFDFEVYKAKLDYENAVNETEPITEPVDDPYEWPLPDFEEAETSPLDSYGGSLIYTPSDDGTTVTISYALNGETVSYTVPNNPDYLFGGYAGVDDLGRSLYDSNDVGAYDPTKRQIGLFYFLWHDENSDRGVFDLQKILDELGMEGAANLNNGKYGSLGITHWFAEPLYGYYYINDEWILRKHAELLTNAGVDFLFIDVTNGEAFLENAKKLMAVLHEFNEQGYDAPQVVFYTNTDARNVVTVLYREIYKPGLYEDTWYKLDGKPVIVAPEGIPFAKTFTIQRTQWPNEAPREDAWPWMDFEWPQRVYTTAEGAPHAVNVSIAQHSGTVCFSDSSLKGNHTNRGRSFVNSQGIPSADTAAFDGVLKSAYEAWRADGSLSNMGLNFQAQWDYALSTDAPTILVTGWNEWTAANWGCFVDTASVEFSRDAEMTRGYYFDNYYMQMIANIQKAKGTSPIILQDARYPINVTGDPAQWEQVAVSYPDPAGDTMYRNWDGYGSNHYTNYTGRNDIVEAKVTSDTQNLYFYVKTAADITKYDTESAWMKLYLNTDRQSSGWYGYDFVVNSTPKGDFTTTVAKYSGTDGSYGFTDVGEVSYRVSGNEMMIAVPLELLGIEGYLEIDVEFKWADSRSVYDEMEDFYCDGDAAPLGRLNYVYQNYIPGVSEIMYPDPNAVTTEPASTEDSMPTDELTDHASTDTSADEPTSGALTAELTEASATVSSDPSEQTPTDEPTVSPATDAPADSTDPSDKTGGCASAVASVIALLMILWGARCLRKRD